MSDVLNPLVPVEIRGERIEVRELNWKDYSRAIKELTGSAMKLLGTGGTLVLDKEKIIQAIGEQESLIQWVVEKSTGRDSKYVSSLSTREILPLISAVVDLNLSEEVLGAGKKLAGQMGGIFGLKIQSLKPSITSSAPATA